jgi:putative ABC transport system permease protein
MGKHYDRSMAPGQVAADELRDIREELELYLEMRTEELVGEGMEPEEARRVAEERFGDTARIESELRRQATRRRAKKGTMMTMGGLRQDLAFAMRTFRRNPGFTFVAVLTLALALAGNTTIFSVVDAALLQAMPFEDSDELVYVNGYHLTNGEIAIRGASFPEFYDWRERARGVSPMAAVGSFTLAISGDGEAESLATEMVTEDYFEVLRVTAAVGRVFTVEEHGPANGSGLAVISDGLWERRYGAEPDVIGQTILLNDQSFTVVGIMPSTFGGIALNTDVWIPESNSMVLGFDGLTEARGSRFLSVIGRLATTEGQAQQELDVVATELQGEWPRAHEDRFAQIQGFREAYLDTTGELLWVLLGAGAVLLLIAAANVANLLLVRAHGRTKEIVLRRALGAESRRVAGQLLTETMVLAVMGGVAGLGLAYVGLQALGPMIPQGVLPGYVDVELSARTFGFSLAVLGVVGVFMGLVPAAASSRLEIATTLRESGRSAAGSLKRFRAQHLFVVAQVGLALVLMVGAGLLTRSFRAQLGVDTGSSIENVVAMRVSLPAARYPDNESRRIFANEIERLASELPGVTSASISSRLPFRGGSSGAYVFKQTALDERIRFHRHSVAPGYLETVGIELSAGRFISNSDLDAAAAVGVITEAMVQRVFPGENPIGQTMYLRPGGDPDMGFEIIGVVKDVRYRDLTTSLLAERNSPDVYFAYDQLPTPTIEVAVRVQGEPASYVTQLRGLAAQLDADLPVFDIQPLIEGYRAQTAVPRFAAFLMSLFSALAVILACVGIYGVLAFAVGQRAQEIAIRRAIGATAPSVAKRVVADALKLSSIGLVAGGVGAVWGSRVLENFLFEVPRRDPVTFGMVGGAMVAVAVLAAVIPAVRAARRDPAEILGAE